MAQVTIKINGYAYTVGCEDGQEDHLQAMAAQIERRIADIKALGGQSGESRLLVLAALLMADELHDVTAAMHALRAGAPAAAGAPGAESTPASAPWPDPALGRQLNELAERAEEIAAALERA